ncbi:hypothetical protein BD626DRAFT_624831 [Schizophyllum amplum]|uniref:F-box domain-containing protein n=1 Tax=Schizophyllum amplum TaxID=97359 RepID=A0A550CXF6_9AGAR|nr:hypothetical protein BD626DRAFT_624831 [Auriculariopsis ampla]
MRHISLCCGVEDESSVLTTLTEAIMGHCRPASLRRLKISKAHGIADDDVPEPWPLLFEHVAPLIAFNGLAAISISAFHGTTITDGDCEQLAQAWPAPQLGKLTFDVHGTHATTVTCTLAGVAAFARHCPLLHRINIPFDATIIPTDLPNAQRQLAAGVLARQVEVVAKTFANISDAPGVAQFLSKAFQPKKLEVLHRSFGTAGFEDTEVERRDVLWLQVQSIVSGRH